ncbi:MAG: hypothetical protein KJ945_16680, partial [Gammaproteobacteria bacterium]|nr:hypothetical protein [Gammaproteobacteria bacterium]
VEAENKKGAAARLPEQVWCDAFVVILQTAVGLPEAELASSVPACGGRQFCAFGVAKQMPHDDKAHR